MNQMIIQENEPSMVHPIEQLRSTTLCMVGVPQSYIHLTPYTVRNSEKFLSLKPSVDLFDCCIPVANPLSAGTVPSSQLVWQFTMTEFMQPCHELLIIWTPPQHFHVVSGPPAKGGVGLRLGLRH